MTPAQGRFRGRAERPAHGAVRLAGADAHRDDLAQARRARADEARLRRDARAAARRRAVRVGPTAAGV